MIYFGLPVLRGWEDLSAELHISVPFLRSLSNRRRYHYREFEIPRAGRKPRRIAAPSRSIKAVQRWVLRRILECVDPTPFATAFRLGKNLTANAAPHRGNRVIACIDVQDFFDSISERKIATVFKTIGYSGHVAGILARLCCFDGRLPQGGVTSPALANLVCVRLDRRIAGYCAPRGIGFSRYADDITLSCQNERRIPAALRVASDILKNEGFQLREEKTRVMGPGRRRLVTGLVLSDESVGIGRRTKRRLRSKIEHLLQPPNPSNLAKDVAFLRGWFAHLRSVDKSAYNQLSRFADKLATTRNVTNPLSPP